MATEPGPSIECARWLHEHTVTAVGSHNYAIEMVLSHTPGVMLPLHNVLIRDTGMPLADIVNREALADECADDRRWSFPFVAPRLHISNAVGSPTTPIAVK